jgi:hypothetical protein
MMVFVSFVMVRLSQKSARTGSKYRNIVEIVVTQKNELDCRNQHPAVVLHGHLKAPA